MEGASIRAPCTPLESPIAEADVYAVDITDRPELTQARLGLLDDDGRARATAFRFPVLMQRYVATWSAVRELLGVRLDIRPELVPIGRSCPSCGSVAHGKPFIDLPVERAIQFNITHSARRALIAIADRPIGIDLEENDTAEPSTAQALYAVALAQEEREVVDHFFAEPALRRWEILRDWVRKEAVIKALGAGLALAPNSFSLAKVGHVTIGSRSVNVEDISIRGGIAAIAWCDEVVTAGRL